jgi:PAS domain S-box-containing protein
MDFASIIEEIKRLKPDVVFSTLFGESNRAFYQQYHAAGIDARSIPIMGVCLSEAELQPIADVAAGHYACQNYFQSLTRPENQRFVANIRKRCGVAQVCSAPMATAYSQIYLWKRVVEAARSFDASQVRSHVVGCEFVGPTGPIVIQQNHHTSMSAYIGRATPDGEFEIIGTTYSIRPLTWLGVENSKLQYKTAIKEAMAAFPNVQNALADLAAEMIERKKADGALRESEVKYRTLIEQSLEGIMIGQGSPFRVVFANPAMAQMLGYSLDELTSLSPKEVEALVHPEDRALFFGRFGDRLQEKPTPAHYEFRAIRKDGQVRWFEVSSNRIEYQGQPAVQATFIDRSERKLVEDALRVSEERFRRINENMLDMVVQTDVQGICVYASPSFKTVLGYDPKSMLGQSLYELVHPDDVNGTLEIILKALATKSTATFDYRYKHADGHYVWLESVGNPLFDETGQITGTVLATRDITERKRMEQKIKQYSTGLEELVKERTNELSLARGRLDLLIKSNPAVIYSGKPLPDLSDFVLTFMSDRVVGMLGYAPEDFLGHPEFWKEHVPSEDQNDIYARMVHFWKEGHLAVEYRFLHNDGTYRWIREEADLIRGADGSPVEVNGYWIDISERKQMETMRDKFVAEVTDELMAPLISMKGYLDLITSESQPMSGDFHENLEAVNRNTSRLIDLTNQLVDLRQLGAERFPLDLKAVNLQETIGECVDEIQPLIRVKKQTLHVDVAMRPLMVQGDSTKLNQVLMALLNNASTFTPEGGTITLHTKETEKEIQVQVSDTGIGLRSEDIRRVFEPFAAIQKTEYVKGAGLGLSLTKGLVEAHGGRIWAESASEGKGATFTFTLPKQRGQG